MTPGTRAIAGKRLVEERRLGGVVGVLGLRKREVEREQVGRLEPGVHPLEPGEALEQQARPGEQRERQRDLGHHQAPPERVAAAVGGGPAAAFLERALQVRRRGVDRGREPEQHARQHRDDEGEDHHRPVDPDLVAARQVADVHRHQGAHAEVGQEQPHHAAGQRDDDALGEELPEQALPRGAERGAHRDLLRPRRGAGQQQVGHVGAGDEEHEPHRAEKDEQGGPDIAGGLEAQAGDVETPVRRVLVGVIPLELLGEGPHLALGLRHRHPGLHPRREVEILVGAAVVGHLIGPEHDRRPDLRVPVEEVAEPARHDPDHLEALAVERQTSADDLRIRPEDPLPGVVAEHRDVLAPHRVLARLERAAQHGRHLQRGEVPSGDPLPDHPHRLPHPGQIGLPAALHRHGLERAALPLIVDESRHRDRRLQPSSDG